MSPGPGWSSPNLLRRPCRRCLADPSALLAVGFLGMAASALGFVTWSFALARYSVTITANSLYLVPLLAIGIGWMLLEETPTVLGLLGGAIAVTGVAASRHH